MSSQSTYSRNNSHPRPYYAPQASMSSADSEYLYGSTKEMGPPYPAQPFDIDLNNPRTLPNPSPSAAASASNAWDSPIFPSSGIGEGSPYAPLNIPRQRHMDTQVRSANQHPILSWYISRDGPWIPKAISEGIPDERQPRTRVGSAISNPYGSQYRQPAPSDAGSYPYAATPSDSGYASHGARRSDGNASIFSQDVTDRDQDPQSMAGQPVEYQSYQGMGEVLQSRDIRSNDQWAVPLPSSMITDAPPSLMCPTCNKPVKTRSELKKHELRHTKPFICKYQGCMRTEGFSTSNDLERHTKSRHPSAGQGMESTKRYRCLAPGCKSKEKSWPRLDNFRSHLKRVHQVKVDQEDDMIRRGEVWETTGSAKVEIDPSSSPRPCHPEPFRTIEPIVNQTQTGVRPTERSWKRVYPNTMESFRDPSAVKITTLEDQNKSVTPQQKDSSSGAKSLETIEPLEIFPSHSHTHHKNPSALGHILATPVSRISAIKENRASPPPVTQTLRTNPQGKATRHDVSASDAATITEIIKTALVGAKVSDADDCDPHHSARKDLPDARPNSGRSRSSGPNVATSSAIGNGNINPIGSPAAQDSSRDSEAQRKAIEVLKTLHELGYIIHKDPTHVPKARNPGSAASSKSENLVTCQNCGKFTGRPCELKKHMKRHSRPYGCTFLNCSKKFGSKNDWKRHENSQHFHHETWRCNEEKPEGGACAKVCYRRQTFQDHLGAVHSISDVEAVKDKVEACRIGRNCQARFWCGFCARLIDLTKKGIEAWNERFDHIDDHFMGRHSLPRQSIQDWVPLTPRGDIASQDSLNPSPGKESDNDSSSPSGSSHESSSDGPDSAGASPAHAANLDSHAGSSNKRKHSGSSDATPPPKRKAPYRGPTLVYCCQCTAAHNPKIDTTCTNCNDSHQFCDSCTYKRRSEDAPEDRFPDSHL